MKKLKKVYAVNGMMEYQTVVKLGKNKVKVSFTGGSVSNGCAQPARYMTSDLIMQGAIEGSADYASGRIRLERSIVLKDELKIERARGKRTIAHTIEKEVARAAEVAKETAGAPYPAAEELRQPIVEDTVVEDTEVDEQPAEVEAEVETEEAAEVETEVETGDAAESNKEIEVVEVSCKDVAKQYLQEHYGEAPAPLRTRDDVQRCAAKYGITFNFV